MAVGYLGTCSGSAEMTTFRAEISTVLGCRLFCRRLNGTEGGTTWQSQEAMVGRGKAQDPQGRSNNGASISEVCRRHGINPAAVTISGSGERRGAKQGPEPKWKREASQTRGAAAARPGTDEAVIVEITAENLDLKKSLGVADKCRFSAKEKEQILTCVSQTRSRAR